MYLGIKQMNNIPILCSRGKNIPEAWEDSLLQLYYNGCDIATQYDQEGDPLSKDCTMIIEIEDPLSEPIIHKMMVGGYEDLQEYTMEVLDGIKDYLIDGKENHWIYSYHDRLRNYKDSVGSIDQIAILCEQLAKCGYTRRAQAITWNPFIDMFDEHPPCLQRLYFRIINDTLNMNLHIRSNDAFRAGFMNLYTFTRLQEYVAKEVSRISEKEIRVGCYRHIADSYHIYGSNIEEFENRFLKCIDIKSNLYRTFEERTVRYEDVKDIMEEAIPIIKEKVRKHAEENSMGE